MNVIICYDVSDNKLRYRLVKYLEKFAIRVQYSVFKADLTDKEIRELNSFVDKILCKGIKGNLQIYKIGDNCSNHLSKKLPDDFLIL